MRRSIAHSSVFAFFVQGSVKGSGSRLIAAAGNGGANFSVLEVVVDFTIAVGFVSQDPPGMPSSDPLDGPLLHENLELCGFVALTSSEHTGRWFAFAFDPQMQFCAASHPEVPPTPAIQLSLVGSTRDLL